MKIYCELCKKVQPVQIDNGVDVKTKRPYQDIVCAECGLVIASGTGIAQPKREWVGLTEEDFYKKDDETVFVLGMKFAEARLKEKNHVE